MATWQGTKNFTAQDKYNLGDINRESGNAQYLKDEYRDKCGYDIPLPATVKTTYAMTDFPKRMDLNNLRQNINALKAGAPADSWPGVPAVVVDNTRLQVFDYSRANALELSLQALYDLLQQILARPRYSPFYCGRYDDLE